MEYTGERCIPGKKGLELLELEHRARYALACAFAEGRRVLDLGSGAGYGAAMLAEKAAYVLGADISEEAVSFAQNAFAGKNLAFLAADICGADFPERILAAAGERFDCVVCFEMIEHVPAPLTVIQHVKRLLSPGGLFIVSTPNINYPFDAVKSNPHHVMEYSKAEFTAQLTHHFRQVSLSGQQIHLLSSIGYAPDMAARFQEWRSSTAENAKYFVAVCSDREEPLSPPQGLLVTGDAHLHLVHSRLNETRQDQAEKGQRIRLLEEALKQYGTINPQFVKRMEETRQQLKLEMDENRRIFERLTKLQESEERLRRQVEDLKAHVVKVDRENKSSHSQYERQLHDFKNHPAVRRLLRFSPPGLKVLGLFGLDFWKHLRRGKRAGGGQGSRGGPSGETGPSPEKPDIPLLSAAAVDRRRTELLQRPMSVLVSIIMPAYNRSETIGRAIDSVLKQRYTHWELIVVDDGSTDNTRDMVQTFSQRNGNIRYVAIPHAGVSAARDKGLQESRGEIIAYLDSDNEWSPEYLLFMVHALADSKRLCGYCALRIVDHNDHGFETIRARGYDYEALTHNNYIDINIFVHHREAFKRLGGFDHDLKRWVDWDLILRYVKRYEPVVVPIVLATYHRKKSLQQITLEEPETYKYKVLNKHLIDWARLENELVARPDGLVSIIIPVWNDVRLTRACLDSIKTHTSTLEYEIVLVDNGSNAETAQELCQLAQEFSHVQVVRNYENYMFALGNNIGVAASHGKYIVLLNNDTEVTHGWLSELVSPLRLDVAIGLAGPKLLYPEGTVQAAGMVFSAQSKIPYHIYRNAPGSAPYVNKRREFQALTGACLALRAEDYIRLRGLDPCFANGGEDIDFCFRVRTVLNKKILYTPQSVIYHHEGKSPGRNTHIQHNRRFLAERWGGAVVPDDQRFYAEDGFQVLEYFKPGREPDGETAVYMPKLANAAGAPVNFGPAGESGKSDEGGQGRTLNIGFVSIWHVRGVTFVTKQLADALESEQIHTHILARWESEKFDNTGPVHHPRVWNGGDDPTPQTMVDWARDNQLDVVIFVEVHPNDWKRVEALKSAGIRVICYEHLDILRREMFPRYGIFDHYLFPAFYPQEVFKAQFPGISTLVIPWGIPENLLPRDLAVVQADGTPNKTLQFVHVAGWGGLNNRKNTDLLIEAFHQARPQNAELHVYSQVPIAKYGARCEKIVSENRHIILHEGTIENIFEAYRGMDMLLWPSKREGLGLPIIEALACGLPVLISDGYMMKQWIIPNEHGVVCPATPMEGAMYLPEMQVNVPQLTEMLRDLAAHPEKVLQLKANVRRDRNLWLWSWQTGVFREQLGRIVEEPAYRPPDDLSYLPERLRDFEQKRKDAAD